jgi:hypothetical protein
MPQNAKHTPGPWIVHTPRKAIRSIRGGDTGIEILAQLPNGGGYQTVVGHVNCQHNQRILTPEDARLIAASPKLLALLRKARHTLVILCDVPPESDCVKEIDAAIAEAEGC